MKKTIIYAIIISIIILVAIPSILSIKSNNQNNNTKNNIINSSNNQTNITYNLLENKTNITMSFYDNFIQNVKNDTGDVSIYFCNYNECEQELINIINSSNNVVCAFYDINLESLIGILETKPGLLILDKKMKDKSDDLKDINMEIIYKDQSALMHNKFCILDNNKVLTGSMNPTKFGTNRNDNDFVLIESELLSEKYLSEIEYLYDKTEIKSDNIIIFNDFIIETYFCPRECDIGINRLVKLINLSQKSIHIAAFSFTFEEIFLALLEAHERGVEINIIMEKRMINSKSSKFEFLQDYGINIIFDSNPGSMHHKFIVIDGEIVQFGSMNYSNNGINRNNENILIIYNSKVANAFLQEFERLWNKYA